MTLTRRALLGLAAATAVAGCTHRSHPPTAAPADADAVAAALAAERALLDQYDAAIAALDAVAAGPLSRARDRHLAHLHALAATTSPAGPVTTPTPSAPPTLAATTGALAGALAASAPQLQQAAATAGSGHLAARLASIAAEHAADVSALRGSA